MQRRSVHHRPAALGEALGVSREVLAAAKRLAERQALAGASMADIAREAGITRVTLYRRGETRAAIVAALREGELHRERGHHRWHRWPDQAGGTDA